jgi:O-antigen ligase
MTLAIFFPAMRAGAESPAFTRATLLCIAVTAAVIAAFGMLVEHLELPTIGLLPKQAYIGWVTGTFVSRNAAAAFFVVGLIISISIITAPEHERRSHVSGRARAGAAICAMFILPALLLTGSRAGILSGLAGLCLLAFMRLRQASLGGISHIAFAAIGVMAVSLVGSALLLRADDSISSNINRYSLYQESIAAISDRLWLGHGAGAFQAVQPLYHQTQTSSDFVWQNAHSLYLEAGVTLGLPMAAILIAGFAAIWIALFRRQSSGAGVATEAALAAGLAVALHASVDFALQTQAVALTIAVLCGLGAGEIVARGIPRDRI